MYIYLTRSRIRETRIPHLFMVKSYLNNYFSMYKRLTLSLMYSRRTRIPCLVGVRNCLNNYFVMYTRVTRSHIHADLASLTYVGLRII